MIKETGHRLPITVTIICKNEIERISESINSVISWVDEVIVIDSGSTDGTQAQVKKMGCKLYFNKWEGFGQQKRFAEELAQNDWILNLDADEYVLPELRDELKRLFEKEINDFDCYKIPIHDLFLCSRKLSTYVLHNYIRLYRKSRVRYRNSAVHDSVVAESDTKIGQLKSRIAHDSLKSFRHRVEKMNDYTDAQVIDLLSKGRKINRLRLIFEIWWTFWVCYLIRGYWRNGLMGYIYAVNFAYSRFLRLIKLHETESQVKKTTDQKDTKIEV